MFHGRGGAIGAGGGKAHADILSAPPGTVQGGVRVIEQGELVANKYGVRAIALRTLRPGARCRRPQQAAADRAARR